MSEDVQQLKEEINTLRNITLSLRTILLQHGALLTVTDYGPGTDSKGLIGLAEECFRYARVPGLKAPIAEGLEAAGHELMARAVELDTKRQRNERSDD
jgi:hypothetical protein